MGTMKDLLELLEDADDISIEITAAGKDDDDQADEPEEKDPEEVKIDAIRDEVKALREKVRKERGEEHVGKVEETATLATMIAKMIDNCLPLSMETVEKYNSLCRELFPQNQDDFLLGLLYEAIEHAVRKVNI